MIDAIDVLLVKNLQYGLVELARGTEVAPEWLFDNDACPAAVTVVEARRPQPFDDSARLGRRYGEVEQMIRAGAGLPHLVQSVAQFVVELRLVDIATEIVQTVREFLPD